MNVRKTSYSDAVGVIILLFMLFTIVGNHIITQSNRIDLEQNARYTIGVTGKSFGARHGSTIEYFYNVNNTKYRQTQSKKGEVNYPGGKYIIVFSMVDPQNSEILFNQPVYSAGLKAPENGWSTKPKLQWKDNW